MPLTAAEKETCGALALALAYLEGAGDIDGAAEIRVEIRELFRVDSIPPQRGKNTA